MDLKFRSINIILPYVLLLLLLLWSDCLQHQDRSEYDV